LSYDVLVEDDYGVEDSNDAFDNNFVAVEVAEVHPKTFFVLNRILYQNHFASDPKNLNDDVEKKQV
jgi:hypothetical protein